ncbi:XAC0095 family protein [Dyella flava]|uniref:XAC0095-like domain-containing protein n=1 Tax=Dyella flava TaxID=1920170 RepID=A0ABS2K6Z8_9GAMM|nr:hypothetical protein [Dyella flava]MBM7126978.1 hypothetical protein [Dyella flava]GLQ50261.1 hypothetical protein GCM10010872_17100 [Dyella flava]
MNKPTHTAPIARSYLLSEEHFYELRMLRDHLLLMAQLAGTASTNGENDVIHFVRRSLIGQLFGDLSFQIAGLVDAVAQSEVSVERAQTH